MAAGVYSEWEQIFDFLHDAKVYEPDAERSRIYEKAYQVYLSLYRQLGPSFKAVQTFYE